MIPFLAGGVLVWLSIFAWIVLAPFAPSEPATLARFLMIVGITPLLTSWLTLELVVWLRSPRLFDPRLRRLFARAATGAAGAALAALATALLLPAIDRWVPDAAITGATSALATALLTLFLPRVAPGACVHCGYDLRGATALVCPECGREPISAA
ncbi:MAG: hypothetical protein AB7K52_10785 [Phycisphaerales bacterium]